MADTEGKNESVERIKELIDGISTCVIATHTADGGIVSRPMGVQETDFDGDLWFLTSMQSELVAQVRADEQVNVTFVGKGTWVSLRGRAEIVADADKKRELAGKLTAAFLQEEPDSPDVALLCVHTDAGEYWSSQGPKTVVELIKARVTGDRPDAGENDTVRL